MLATTPMDFGSQGNDGSFMRLFRYISGGNQEEQKVAMTTPVFMEMKGRRSSGQMAFVVPKQVAEQGIPQPTNNRVQIRQRSGGRFAVIRFNGKANRDAFVEAEQRLRDWMNENELMSEGDVQFAGYDPPWTPAPLRRKTLCRSKPAVINWCGTHGEHRHQSRDSHDLA